MKILFTGDIFISKPVDKRCIFDDAFKQKLSCYDYVAGNIEAPIVTNPSQKINKAGPYLKHDSYAGEVILNSGFNIMNLANNHIYDYGDNGILDTLNFFSNNITLGAGSTFNEAYSLKIINKDNIKIGLLSFAEGEFGALFNDERQRSGYAWINHYLVDSLIKEAKKTTDYLLVQVHAGIELETLPLPEWRNRYRDLIDKGVDLIIGHHPHVPQGWEVYKEKYIFYSLGNLYVDLSYSHPLSCKSYGVAVEIDDQKFDVHTVPLVREGDKVKEDTDSDYLIELCASIADESYINSINTMAVQLWEKRYTNYYFDGITKKKIMLLHNIRIESHRWIVERALTCLTETNEFQPGSFYKDMWLQILSHQPKALANYLISEKINNVIIMGTGTIAQNIYNQLEGTQVNVEAFLDNYSKNSEFKSKPIITEQQLGAASNIQAIIITIEGNHDVEIMSRYKRLLLSTVQCISWKKIIMEIHENYLT